MVWIDFYRFLRIETDLYKANVGYKRFSNCYYLGNFINFFLTGPFRKQITSFIDAPCALNTLQNLAQIALFYRFFYFRYIKPKFSLFILKH